MKFCVLLTCFNRKEKTVNCIESLIKGNASSIDFVVVDDGSTDGTCQDLEEMAKELQAKNEGRVTLEVIRGQGGLYYSRGMRRAMEEARSNHAADYFVLINDDVDFDAGVLDGIAVSPSKNRVLVGPMRDDDGKCSYGGIKYCSGIHYKQVGPDSPDRECDTFNANFVAVPGEIFFAVPIIDPVYIHSLGDFDYGLQIKRAGFEIQVMDHYAGVCNNNPSKGTWNDKTLPRAERIRRKESVKGAPAKQWFHFLKKNFGIGYACLYSVTPYVRILLGK